MSRNVHCFNVNTSKIDDSTSIHIIDIQTIDANLKKLIDEYLVQITQGPDSTTKLSTAKKELQQFFANKTTDTSKIGPIAEFFIHLYLNTRGFKQQCLFLNLEEKNFKKGFDGYYIFNNNTWIMESKSGTSKTKHISHKTKIKEAYDDLKDKLSGNVNNNPWKNAYNHACCVKASTSILTTLKQFSDNFINGNKKHDVKDFNIIPCSTIFYLDKWSPQDKKDIETTIQEILPSLTFNNLHIICLNKSTINSFFDYLKEGVF